MTKEENATYMRGLYQGRVAIGLCGKCGNPADGSLCAKHRRKSRLRNRRAAGSKPWRRGKAGRPPKGRQ